MRSRYSAYALDLPEYIIATTHRANPNYSKDTLSWKGSISKFSRDFSFQRLEILDFQEKPPFATVTFIAHIAKGSYDASFTEESSFEKVGSQWLYRDGIRKN